MSNTLKETMVKNILRSFIRKQKVQIVAKRRQMAAERLRELLFAEAEYHDASNIMFYASLPDEVPTLDFLRDECQKHRFILPKVTGPDNMELRLYTGPHDLSEGAFHIPEPVGPIFSDYSAIDLLLIPGMAFDRHGNRLGRGKGYYDRFLQNPVFSMTPKWGICYDFQVMDDIPTEKHDIAMNRILIC